METHHKPVKPQQIKSAPLAQVRMGYVDIPGMTGKQKLPKAE